MFTFRKKSNGEVQPVSPIGQDLTPHGVMLAADGDWSSNADTLGRLEYLRDEFRTTAVRIIGGVVGENTGNNADGGSKWKANGTPIADVMYQAGRLGMVTQVMGGHAGWGQYLTTATAAQQKLWETGMRQIIAAANESGHPEWVWIQNLPEPGSFSGKGNLDTWLKESQLTVNRIREFGWSGIIIVMDHHYGQGQYGPDEELRREKSGWLRDGSKLVDPAGPGRLVVGFESYGQAWATGKNRNSRRQHVLDYIDAIHEMGLPVTCTDWDFRKFYESEPSDQATNYGGQDTNENGGIAYGTLAVSDALRFFTTVGAFAWRGDPIPGLDGEMWLIEGQRPLVNGTRDDLTYAGEVFVEIADHVFRAPAKPPAPPAPPDEGSDQATQQIEFDVVIEGTVWRLLPIPELSIPEGQDSIDINLRDYVEPASVASRVTFEVFRLASGVKTSLINQHTLRLERISGGPNRAGISIRATLNPKNPTIR